MTSPKPAVGMHHAAYACADSEQAHALLNSTGRAADAKVLTSRAATIHLG